jgi:hypothetical protein
MQELERFWEDPIGTIAAATGAVGGITTIVLSGYSYEQLGYEACMRVTVRH